MILSSIIRILKEKLPVFNQSTGIFYNGQDNNYPDIVNYLYSNSVTAWSCMRLMSSYIGGSWSENPKINDNQNLNQFNKYVSDSLAKHRGVFIHFNFGFNEKGKYIPIDARVLPFADCRLGKKDDNNYNGKIGVSKDWDVIDWFDVYNPDVALKQSGRKFKGQVLYINLDDENYYPKSQLHSVIKDANSEIHASTYKETSLEKGYFGTRWIVTRPIVESELSDESEIKQKQLAEARKFEQNIQNSMGADNSNNVLWLQMNFDSIEDIDKQFVVKDFKSNIDDKLFEFTEKSVANNIRKAHNNIPAILVENQDNAMFGNSGESIKQAQVFYFKNTKQERDIHISIITKVLTALQIDIPNYIPLINETSN